MRILGYPAMLHAKAFVRDGEDVLVGTCNLDAWSLKRFFEIDVLVRSRALAAQFDERFLGARRGRVDARPSGRPGRWRGSSRRRSQRSRRCSDGVRRWVADAQGAPVREACRPRAWVRAPQVEAGPHDCFPRARATILRSWTSPGSISRRRRADARCDCSDDDDHRGSDLARAHAARAWLRSWASSQAAD